MRIRDLRYNDRISAFQATVDIVQSGQRLRFPITVFGPTSLSPDVVNANICRQAVRKATTH